MISTKLMIKLMERAQNSLEGDWILIGGSLLPLLNIEHRVTTDIDLIPLNPGMTSNQSTLNLMQLAEDLKLPPEVINQAGALFVSQKKPTPKDLVLLSETKKCKIYRPSGSFYLLLKFERMTESDLADCLEWLKWCQKTKEALDKKKLVTHLKKKISHERSHPKKDRFERLLKLLSK